MAHRETYRTVHTPPAQAPVLADPADTTSAEPQPEQLERDGELQLVPP